MLTRGLAHAGGDDDVLSSSRSTWQLLPVLSTTCHRVSRRDSSMYKVPEVMLL